MLVKLIDIDDNVMSTAWTDTLTADRPVTFIVTNAGRPATVEVLLDLPHGPHAAVGDTVTIHPMGDAPRSARATLHRGLTRALDWALGL